MATLLQVRDILRERGKYNPDLATQLLLVVIIMAIFYYILMITLIILFATH